MALFWEFFTFELKFRFKSLSTYMYFLLWLAFSFLERGFRELWPHRKQQWQDPAELALCQRIQRHWRRLFGIIVIAAIFGTSVLRDFQRDTYQILFTQPISKFAYLGGRWAGSFVTTVFAFSGMMLGHFPRHFCAVGGPYTHRAESSVGLPSAVSARSLSFRYFSSARHSSRSLPLPEKSSSFICRASPCSCSTSSASPFFPPLDRWSDSGRGFSIPSA